MFKLAIITTVELVIEGKTSSNFRVNSWIALIFSDSFNISSVTIPILTLQAMSFNSIHKERIAVIYLGGDRV